MHQGLGLGAAALLTTMAAAAAAAGQRADSAAFVTVLGNDTVAVERWIRRPGRVDAEVVVRSPRTSLRRSVLELDARGRVTRWEERWLDPLAPDAPPLRVETAEPRPSGGWTRRIVEGDSVRGAESAAPADALPWADLVHWPFELALERVPAGGTVQVPFLAGQRPLVMTLHRTPAGEVTLTHPLRGPTAGRVSAEGQLLSLDAAETTRKVVVTRLPWAEVADPARRWAEADRAGRGMGELSGRAETEHTVRGAVITLDYGTPARRGREIFGRVVPWGELWRTGANRATHLTTSRDLHLGDPAGGTLVVPAGSYTLFSIPRPEGGVLIVNRQTGQNGTAYDPAQDLGRVAMRRREVAAPVERFTIRVDETATGGALVLAWDRTELAVPFEVR